MDLGINGQERDRLRVEQGPRPRLRDRTGAGRRAGRDQRPRCRAARAGARRDRGRDRRRGGRDRRRHVDARRGARPCSAPFAEVDILVNNNGGPPPRDFRAVDHDAMIAGLEANMIAPIALIQAVIDAMVARRFGRIVNITSGSVKMPIAGLDLSSGARAGLTGFLAGVARQVVHANVTINNLLPGAFDTDRIASFVAAQAQQTGRDPEEIRAEREQRHPGEAPRRPRRIRRRLRLPLLGPGRLHHRPEPADRRRRLSGDITLSHSPSPASSELTAQATDVDYAGLDRTGWQPSLARPTCGSSTRPPSCPAPAATRAPNMRPRISPARSFSTSRRSPTATARCRTCCRRRTNSPAGCSRSGSATAIASSSTTTARCTARRGPGGCCASSARTMSPCSTAACRNGGRRAGRWRAATPAAPPRPFHRLRSTPTAVVDKAQMLGLRRRDDDRRRAAGGAIRRARRRTRARASPPAIFRARATLPQSDFFNADNSWKQGDDLRAVFDAAGVDLVQADGDDLRLGRHRRGDPVRRASARQGRRPPLRRQLVRMGRRSRDAQGDGRAA